MDIHLRPWQEGDEEAAVRWSRDAAFCQMNEWTLGLPAQEVREWWRKRGRESRFLQIIVVSGLVVGYAEWQGLENEEAELGIAIGDSACRGQGIGLAAGKLMLAWAFGELELQRVWAEVHAPNLRSVALMRKLGLRELGERGESTYQGKKVAMVQFELGRKEWQICAGA